MPDSIMEIRAWKPNPEPGRSHRVVVGKLLEYGLSGRLASVDEVH